MLLVPYLMAAVRMYEEGFASREDIDNGMKLGCGHPMGPLTLCDFIGLDVLYAVCDSLYEEFKRDEYAPPPLMKRMVASGRLGTKVRPRLLRLRVSPTRVSAVERHLVDRREHLAGRQRRDPHQVVAVAAWPARRA